MFRIKYILLILVLLTYSATAISHQVLKVGVGNFPPFFIEETQSGIFIEIIDEIFDQLPYLDVEYVFMSNNRLIHEINDGRKIDVACNVFPSSNVSAHLSLPIFRFTDVAVSLSSNQYAIHFIEDLENHSIAAYQGATELLGEEFKELMLDKVNYSEFSQPKETTHLLVTGEKDIRIGDINIFIYDLKSKGYQAAGLTRGDFTVHKLWPTVYSHMAFKDPVLKAMVDKVILKLKNEGAFDKIYKKHKL